MANPLNLFENSGLIGGMSYFEYEAAVGREILIPWLSKHMDLTGLRVGDFGCNQGGVLQALREHGAVASGQGFDLNPQTITRSPFQSDENFRIQVGDVTQLNPEEYQFDLILVQDVLEHIPDYTAALAHAQRCLSPHGRIFISFPPYYSPFGGHQHMGSNWAKAIPYLHYLPDPIFYKLVKTRDWEYMSAKSTMEDIASVRETRLTLEKTEQAFQDLGMVLVAQEYFLSRPEFKIRYGFPTITAGFLKNLRPVREFLTLGIYYLVQPERRRSQR